MILGRSHSSCQSAGGEGHSSSFSTFHYGSMWYTIAVMSDTVMVVAYFNKKGNILSLSILLSSSVGPHGENFAM